MMGKVQLLIALIVVAAVGLTVVGVRLQQDQRLEHARALVQVAETAIEQGRTQEVISGLRDLILSDPGLGLDERTRALELLAEALRKADNLPDAVATYEQLAAEEAARSRERTEATRRRAVRARLTVSGLVQGKDPHKALHLAQEAQREAADLGELAARALVAEAQARRALGEEEAAIAILEKIIQEHERSEAASQARWAIGDAKLQRLLAPEVDERWSVWHTIKRGDTLESIALRYGTTVGLLRRINNIAGNVLRPGVTIKAPTVRFKLVVTKSEFALDVLTASDEFVKRYPVGIGRIPGKTREGRYTINTKQIGPRWRDPNSGKWLTPDDPDYPLGTRWLGLGLPGEKDSRTGLGIHGTNEPETVGTASSLGCVRMRNEDVNELYDLAPLGTEVVIRE